MAKPLLGKATLVLLPELSTVGDVDFENRRILAETFEGRSCDTFSRAARESGTWFGFGLPRVDQDGRVHNSYIIATPAGDLLFCNQVNDSEHSGPGYLAFTHQGVELGLAICRGAGTPSTERKILEKTPELVLIPMMAEIGAAYHYKAITWQTSILAVNYAGFHYGYSSLHRFVEGREVFRQSLFINEGFLVTTL